MTTALRVTRQLRFAPTRKLLALVPLVWVVVWTQSALELFLSDRRCAYIAGPFLPCGPGAYAWQKPLLIGLLPLAAIGLFVCLYSLLSRRPAIASQLPY